jgi:tetratricopeptide (TPR) repeat protein
MEKELLSDLWIFQAPFLADVGAEVFISPVFAGEKWKFQKDRVLQGLQNLSRRGFLVREVTTLADGTHLLYRCLPAIRLFIKYFMKSRIPVKTLQTRLGIAYVGLLKAMYEQINYKSWSSYVAVCCKVDLESCVEWVSEENKDWYLNCLGRVLCHIGDHIAGMKCLEQALEIAQKQNRQLEPHILGNIGMVYADTGQTEKALEYYQQALSINRALEDRKGESAMLNNIAGVFSSTGQPKKALKLYRQALQISDEVDDQPGKAMTYSNMANVYNAIGQPEKSREFFKLALSIRSNVGDRTGEAAIRNNIARVFYDTGQIDNALKLLEQAMLMMREVGDRAGEAIALNNMGMMYLKKGQMEKALKLFENTLPIMRDVNNRAGEASVLHNIAGVYLETGKQDKALEYFEQALPIMHDIGDRAGEATTLSNIASLLYCELSRTKDAIERMEQAIAILQKMDLPQDSSGISIDHLKAELVTMKSGLPLALGQRRFGWVSPDKLKFIIINTIAVLTNVPEKKDEWQKKIIMMQDQAQKDKVEEDVIFFNAILSLLDGKTPEIPYDNPYEVIIKNIVQHLSSEDTSFELPALPGGLPGDFVQRCHAGLNGNPQAKQTTFEYLRKVTLSATTPEVEVLIQKIQLLLFGQNPASIKVDLPEPYATIWQAILDGLKNE